MMKITRSILLGFSLVAAFNLISGTASAMNIFKNDFEKRWSELSQDVKKLNEYTKIHLVELRDVKAEGLKLEGVVFTDSTFSGVEWENVNASKAAPWRISSLKTVKSITQVLVISRAARLSSKVVTGIWEPEETQAANLYLRTAPLVAFLFR
jgi:hypothetical protein